MLMPGGDKNLIQLSLLLLLVFLFTVAPTLLIEGLSGVRQVSGVSVSAS